MSYKDSLKKERFCNFVLISLVFSFIFNLYSLFNLTSCLINFIVLILVDARCAVQCAPTGQSVRISSFAVEEKNHICILNDPQKLVVEVRL